MRLVVLASLLCFAACVGPKGQRMTPQEMALYEAQSRPAPPANAGAAQQPGAPSAAARELGARRVQLNAELAALRDRGEELALRHDLEQRGEVLARRHAEQRLARAQRERALHDEVVMPLRLRQAQLDIDEAAARRRAAEEELEAMEELWAATEEEDSATAAALLALAREQAARAVQVHELAQLRRRELVERTLPAQLEALEQELADAGLDLEHAQLDERVGASRRARELQALADERRALDSALASVESESARLGREGGLLHGAGG